MAKDKRFERVYSQGMGTVEIWVDKDWNVKVDNEIPDVPNLWYFPPYVDRVVKEMTTYKSHEIKI